MIENILILDTETTGLHPDKGAKLIEVGALLYNVKFKEVLQTLSTFLPCTENPVQHINNISPEVTQCPIGVQMPLLFLTEMVKHSDAIVAHNADFDKKFMHTVKLGDSFWSKAWICTKADFRWPVFMQRLRLQDVCAAMGVPYVDAHRALNDCQFIADCFNKVPDLGERLNNAMNNNFNNSNRYR